MVVVCYVEGIVFFFILNGIKIIEKIRFKVVDWVFKSIECNGIVSFIYLGFGKGDVFIKIVIDY